MDRFGDPQKIFAASPAVSFEERVARAFNALAQQLDQLAAGVVALANREIPAPQVTVKAPAAPNVTVDLDGVKDALTDAIRALPQDGLTADQVAAAFAQVLQGHKFEIDPDALKALAKARGGGGTISMPNLRDIQLRDASHELVNPATTENVQEVRDRLPDLTGTYKLYAGVSGTADVLAGERIVAVHCVAGASDATVAVGSLAAITVPATRPFTLEPYGNVTGSDVVFTGTVSYVVEVLS